MQPRLHLHVVLTVLLFTLTALAQSSTEGAISGVVVDEHNAVITQARITAIHTETNSTVTGVSDGAGRFRLANLPPGAYTVEIAAPKFAERRIGDIVVEVGRVTTLDTTLPVAPVVQAVTVNGAPTAVETEQQAFSNSVNETAINELPMNERRWSFIALLVPGTAAD